MLGLGHKLGLGRVGMRSAIQRLLSKLNARSTYFENRVASKNLIKEISDDGILDKATILLTPTAYSNARLHSVKTYTGTELVDNGTFATDTIGWTAQDSATLSSDSGRLKIANGATTNHGSAYQIVTVEVGNVYEVVADLMFSAGTALDIQFKLGTALGGVQYYFSGNVTADTTVTEYITATGTSLYVQCQNSGNGGTNAYFDNISVIDVSSDFNFERDSSATRVDEDGLIQDMQSLVDPELVENGDFSEFSEIISNGDFSEIGAEEVTSFTNGTTYPFTTFTTSGNNITSAIVSSAFAGTRSNAISVTSGEIYKVTFDYTKNSGDDLRIVFSSQVSGAGTQISNNELISASGSYTKYFTITSTTTGYFQMGTGNSGHSLNASISNVSVKEVGQDWTYSVTGGATFTFVRNEGWTKHGGSNSNIRQTIDITNGKWYKYSYTREYISGTNGQTNIYSKIDGSGGGYTTLGTYTSTVAEKHTVTGYFQAGDTWAMPFQLYGIGDFTGTFSNVSVEELDPDDRWTLGTGWSIGEDKAVFSGSAFANLAPTAPFPLTSGKSYKVSLTAVVTNGSFKFQNNGVNIISENTSGSYTAYFVSGSTTFNIARESVGVQNDFTITDISVIDVTFSEDVDLPRIDYTGGVGHILLEPQRTNLVTYSEDFSESAWAKIQSSVTSGFSSPDGNTNAYRWQENTASAVHSLKYTYSFASVDYSNSIFIKPNGRTKVSLWIDTASKGTKFDLATGTIYSETSSVGKITAMTDGWFKISTTVLGTSATAFNLYGLDDSWNVSYTGDGTSGFYLWGAQFEVGSFPTSYIPTHTGVAVTRDTEILDGSGNDTLINSTEGVLYAEIAALSDDGTDRRMSINDASASNCIIIGYSRFTGNIIAEVFAGGVLQTPNWGATGVTQADNNKFALSWGSGTMKFYVNGSQTNTDPVTSPSGLNTLELSLEDGSLPMFAKTKCLAVFDEGLENDELEILTGTSYASFELLAAAGSYTVI